MSPYLNDTAVRIRAGLMLAIPIFMAFTLWDIVFGARWEVTGNVIRDTFDTDFDGRTIYMVEALRRTYDYTVQTWLLFYALFEMLAGMTVKTSALSPTIWLANLLASRSPKVWKPLTPKRFAWSIGASMICICLVFFHPEKFAGAVNFVTQHPLLPTTEQYMPRWLPLLMVWLCLGFMWMETVLGFCLGCQVHALLVKAGVLKEECEECNNLDFSR
ncbi:MAG: hypothetical protein B7Y59_05390 [Burkholderiales bacterium 35-55-47]|nr:DUF4395 family protein [Limnohabitans sp.]OYY19136.1 MAG: hypothetical protein B7Y59_05390 [Burkholderiales bacterium 35-55-47]OYZ73145.1 MAG: hypothetical protein B7Y06_07510 [Burkholderiales bacterium 24-55-52]OZB00338.1 MAG: hypothetical protein B7X62_08045 [Burkholderiales bacterium 39-55-53]